MKKATSISVTMRTGIAFPARAILPNFSLMMVDALIVSENLRGSRRRAIFLGFQIILTGCWNFSIITGILLCLRLDIMRYIAL